jgi:hypothetical protein
MKAERSIQIRTGPKMQVNGSPGDSTEIQRVPESYEPRLVAYVDVLGWGSLVERSINDPGLMKTLAIGANYLSFQTLAAAKAREFFSERGGQTDIVLDVTHFSDTVVLSTRLDSPARHSLLSSVQLMSASLLHSGHYTRGGITVGLLVHQEGHLFGPALIRAYELERDVAKYPRIVVDPPALPFVDPRVGDSGEITNFYNVREDADGLIYVDILGFVAGQKNKPRRCSGAEEELLSQAKDRLSTDQADLRRAAKHVWMIRYLESVLKECEPPE